MYETLFEYIQQFNTKPITAEEKEQYRAAFTPFKLRRKQYFLQEGNRCKHFAFIIKGAMRLYTVDESGAEHVVRLGIENWWIGDRESWVMETPSVYNIDAWEDTQMLLLSRTDALALSSIPGFSQMMHRLDDRNNMANQRRITAAISASAEKRFTEFADCYPQLLVRFPQYIIASYLGFTKDTMSRLKTKLHRK